MATPGLVLARHIEHTILTPEATDDDIRRLCEEAIEHGFLGVCVNGVHVPLCRRLLDEYDTHVCAVLSFPLGADSTTVKIAAARSLAEAGADQVDMVLNLGKLKGGEHSFVRDEIAAVCGVTAGVATVKVIICADYLTYEEKKTACALAVQARAHYLKTCTGFGPGGAVFSDVQLMRREVDAVCKQLGLPRIKVQAAGGIRDFATAVPLIEAGADCLGTSAGVGIMASARAAADADA